MLFRSNGYTWDKIVTANGIEGYIARGNSKEQYVEVVSSNDGNNIAGTTTKNDNFKLDDSNLVCEPATTVEAIKEKYTDKTITVKKADGTAVTTGNIGTGYIVTIGDKKYIIVKKGDSNGDGVINSADLLVIQKHLLQKQILDKETSKGAADSNNDGIINSAD